MFVALGAGGLIVVLLAALGILALQRRIIGTPPVQAGDIETVPLRWFSGNLGRSLLSVVSFALIVDSGRFDNR